MLLNGIIGLLLLHSIICKYQTKKFIWLTSHFYLSNGGRILRYNRCECGIENIQNINYDRIDSRSAYYIDPRYKRIIGGEAVIIDQYPWVVGLFSSRYDEHPYCGASLISNRHLITAAHCIEDVVARYASLSDHDTTTKKETTSFLRRIRPYRQSQAIHENYKSAGAKEFPLNDIAILELDSPIRFANARYRSVRPICMPDPENELEDEWVTVVGWGRREYFGHQDIWHEKHKQSDILRSVQLKTFRQTECDLIYGGMGDVKKEHLCAYYEGRDACQGDSGGPLFTKRHKNNTRYDILRYEIVGITSFGRDCGLSGFPGVYTRIGDFVWWILRKMQKSKGITVICRGTLGKWIQGK